MLKIYQISRVTDAVLDEVSDWQNRALEPMYPIVFLDALHVKIRDAESRQVNSEMTGGLPFAHAALTREADLQM
jgi:transposase-like protein